MTSTPDSSQARRKHPRAQVSLLVQYRFNSVQDFLAEHAVNISPGGIFIATERPAPVGTMLYLQFSLKDGSRLIEGMGRVAHVQQGTATQPHGMGIAFVQFDGASRELIERICAGR